MTNEEVKLVLETIKMSCHTSKTEEEALSKAIETIEHDVEKELNELDECEQNKGKSDGIEYVLSGQYAKDNHKCTMCPDCPKNCPIGLENENKNEFFNFDKTIEIECKKAVREFAEWLQYGQHDFCVVDYDNRLETVPFEIILAEYEKEKMNGEM